jgi:hypothetical protein
MRLLERLRRRFLQPTRYASRNPKQGGLHPERTPGTLPTDGVVETEIPDIKGPGSHVVVVHAWQQVEQATEDCDLTQWSDDSRKSQLAGKMKTGVLRQLLFGAMAVCLLLWVALYNGYPTGSSNRCALPLRRAMSSIRTDGPVILRCIHHTNLAHCGRR